MARTGPVQTNIPATGSFGGPPPDAPIEVAEPLAASTVDAMVDAANRNERALKPLKYEGSPRIEGSHPQGIRGLAAAAAKPERVRTHAPAASNSDSPSRGVPRPEADPKKVITGGFGDLGEAQYYALDGSELRELVRSLMDFLNQRLENDLRFAPAICYPRVTAKVTIEVSGYTQDKPFIIEKSITKNETPLEVVEATGAEATAFTLEEQRREFDDAGNAQDPPNRIREELGLTVPRKQIVRNGAMSHVVDRVPDRAELF